MRLELMGQLAAFGQSILLGAALALVYDLLRPLRRRRPGWTAGLDGLYCLSVGLGLFFFTLRLTGGQLRLYALLGALGGGVLFFSLFSAPLRPLWDFWADTAGFLWHLIWIPWIWWKNFCKKLWAWGKNLFYFARK